MKLTKAARAAIVKEFTDLNDGVFDPKAFVDHVRNTGESHPAYEFFGFEDVQKAAEAHWVSRARDFVRDLTISFQVNTVSKTGSIIVVESTMPLALSPMEGRANGGGYRISDPSNPTHLAELCRQGADALDAWKERYGAAIIRSGIDPVVVDGILTQMRAAGRNNSAEG